MPDPVAPAAPAPAAPSAPASSPAPATPAAPVTPAPAAPVTPVVETPAAPVPAAPATPGTPVKFDPATSLTPPKSSDFSNDPDGLNEFIKANSEWLSAHPTEAEKIRTDKAASIEEGAVPATPEAALAETVKAAEGTQDDPAKAAAVPATPAEATPAAIEEWTAKSPELKAAFEKNPELQAAVMDMARENVKAKEVTDIVGTKEEAQFAVEHAQKLVGVQSSWMLAAEDPDLVGSAYDQTVDFFVERDENGAVVKGADGSPKMAADFPIFQKAVGVPWLESYASSTQTQIVALEARLAGSYPNDEARAADADALEKLTYEKAAWDFVKGKVNESADPASNLPKLPPNATPEQIAYQKTLEDRQKELDAKEGKQTTAGRKEARAKLNIDVDRSWSKTINDHINSTVNAMKERGEYLPDFVLNDKFINPQTQQPTKVSELGARMWIALNQKINSLPIEKANLARLEALGPAGQAARVAKLDELTKRFLPKLLEGRIKEIQDSIRGAGKKPPSSEASPARVEPQSQATVVPAAGMDSKQTRAWAEAEAKKDPSFANLEKRDQETMIISLQARKRQGL